MDRLGEIERAVRIHRIDKPRVELIQPFAISISRRAQPEAEQAEPGPAGDLEARRVADTGRHGVGPGNMVADDLLKTGHAVAADHEPQLQGPEAAAKFQRQLRIVGDPLGVLGHQIGRGDRHRLAEILDRFHEMRRTVEIRHQPFMRIHHQRVGKLYATRHIAEFRADQGGTGPGGVDMREQPFLARDWQNLVEPVAGADPGAAEHAADRAGTHPCLAVSGDGGAQGSRIHCPVGIGRHPHQVLAPDPGQEDGLFDRRMRLIGGVDPQHRLAGQTRFLAGPIERLFARRQDRRQRRHAGPCLDDAVPPLADPSHLAKPVEDMDLHFRAGRRGLPQQAV